MDKRNWFIPHHAENARPLSKAYRLGAWFILVMGIIAILGGLIFGVIVEGDFRIVLFLVPVMLFTHVFGTLAVTGFPTTYARIITGQAPK